MVSIVGFVFDIQINIYSGNCGVLVCEVGDDDGGLGFIFEVIFCIVVGIDYWIYVDGFGGDEGYFLFIVICEDDIIFLLIFCFFNFVFSNDMGDCGVIVNYVVVIVFDFCGIVFVIYS